MREPNMSASDNNTPVSGLKCLLGKFNGFELPTWLALILVAGFGLLVSGCISARQTYGLDQNALNNINVAHQKTDPTITGALPAGQNNWTPHFYKGTGVQPGQQEPQSAPFTPKGIGSAAGLPPKPNVNKVDLPAPPLPLPESTAAPSTTLFGRAPIGRQSGFSSRGSNFGGTALGWQPKFHQPSARSGLKVFPNQHPTPAPGFRVANNQALSVTPRSFNNLQPQPLPFPNLGHVSRQPQTLHVPQAPVAPSYVAPRSQNYTRVTPPVVSQQQPLRQVPNQNLHVFNRQHANKVQRAPSAPTFNVNGNIGGYAKPPVPKGSNLVVTRNGYQVDTGDQLNIRVLGQADLTGQYKVDSTGSITMPMLSTVFVRGKTVSQISNLIQSRLRQGFLRTPSVAVEINSARPFYILGQVKNPGKYNFVNGLTVSQAVAIAGGYQPRAKKGMVRVTRQTRQGPITAVVPNEEPLSPGDTIYVKQRWF